MSRRSEVIFEAVTELKDDLIEAAQTYRFVRKRVDLRRWAALAACLAVVIGLGALFASGGMGGMTNDGAAADGSDAGGGDAGSGGAAQENGTAEDDAFYDSDPSFTNPAGPILSLTLKEQNDAITAERTVELGFDGYGEDIPFWGDGYRIAVTDHYTLANTADTAQTVTLLYPVAGSLDELDVPVITVDGQTVAAAPMVGGDAGFGRDGDDQDWAALLADEGYLADALDGPEDLSGVKAIVYTVSSQQRPEGADAAALALEFSYDPAETRVLGYGFDGVDLSDGEDAQYSGFVRSSKGDWTLIVLGEDIEAPHLQGYEDGGCATGEELSTVTGTLTRRETTLEEALRMVAEDYWNRQTDRAAQGGYEASWELLYAAAADSVLVDDGELPLLQEGLLARKTQADRVVWFAVETTIPAGGSVEVEAAYTKAASLNYGPSDLADKDLCGYELLPYAGSNLSFTGQTTLAVGEEAVPGWYGSLTFGGTALTEERYVLYTYQ